MNDTAESKRLSEAQSNIPWKKWGPYLSERQWATVREDYSADGSVWNYFSHDQSRSRAYRWGEDGLAGISDDKQRLCFALALWNGKDPIIKERLFGLTNSEGNHGEDVKEYYFYLDSTPTHSYMKYLYKYPQGAYPYDDLLATNRLRNRAQLEYELLDTGVFELNRYFDVFVEYAKETPEDILIRITVSNRGTEPASLHVLPTLWFRNTWSWSQNEPKPSVHQVQNLPGVTAIMASHATLGDRFLYCEGDIALLFTENETNSQRLFGTANRTPYVKDGINNTIVYGISGATNPEKTGTKVSPHYQITVDAGGTSIIRLRLSNVAPADLGKAYRANRGSPFQSHFDVVLAKRAREADEFYASIIPDTVDGDKARVMRQALAGMLWSKQHYSYDGYAWLGDHHADPFAPDVREARNAH